MAKMENNKTNEIPVLSSSEKRLYIGSRDRARALESELSQRAGTKISWLATKRKTYSDRKSSEAGTNVFLHQCEQFLEHFIRSKKKMMVQMLVHTQCVLARGTTIKRVIRGNLCHFHPQFSSTIQLSACFCSQACSYAYKCMFMWVF